MGRERGGEAVSGTRVDESSIKEMVDVARAMTEGDFYRELNIKLYGELGRLAEYIDQTRRNLQQIDIPLRDASVKIPQASSQLFDVTESTERATHNILTLIERILDNQEILSAQIESLQMLEAEITHSNNRLDEIGGIMKLVNSENQSNLIEILTSLSFQDITGQKIQKVIGLVGEIEAKILEMIVTFGIKMDERSSSGRTDRDKEKLILQLKDPSKSFNLKQDLVDEILTSFKV